MPKKSLTTEEFINRSRAKFGDKFVYTDTRYVTQLTKVDLSCRVHGKFKILPSNHLKGTGCPKCSRALNGFNHRLTTEDYIKECQAVHNDFYDYSKTVFTGSFQNIIVTCPVHGDFIIQANRHKNIPCGCQKCGHEKRTRTPVSVFIENISKKKNFCNYDFSKITQFKNKFDSVIATCNIHGEYRTKPAYIENSIFFGCRKCKIDDSKHDTATFIKRSTKAHNGFYSYKNSSYFHAHGDVYVTCPIHGDYLTKPLIHVLGGGFCPICTPTVSSYEKQLRAFLNDNYISYEETFRGFRDVKEVDIINHDIKLGIEFNGLYWHSDFFKEKNYHLKKTEAMHNLGYRLIHIFEDEWIKKRAICESIILNVFNKTKNKIYARNCTIKEVSANEAKDFLIHNHIQGNCISRYRYGLYHKNELVMLATFGKHRINLGAKAIDGEYELLRLSGLINTGIIGGASKLLTFFITRHTPKQIISYCDKRYGIGNMYRKLGFKELYHTKPNYFYVRGNNRFNRFSYRKDILVSRGYDKSKTEKTIMNELGYRRIYDCGSIKFKWENTFNNENEALANRNK